MCAASYLRLTLLKKPSQKTKTVDFLRPLVDAMVVDDPSKRPTIDEVITQFEEIVKRLSWVKLRSRIVYKESSIGRAYRRVRHILRTIGYIATFRPAIPTCARAG